MSDLDVVMLELDGENPEPSTNHNRDKLDQQTPFSSIINDDLVPVQKQGLQHVPEFNVQGMVLKSHVLSRTHL